VILRPIRTSGPADLVQCDALGKFCRVAKPSETVGIPVKRELLSC